MSYTQRSSTFPPDAKLGTSVRSIWSVASAKPVEPPICHRGPGRSVWITGAFPLFEVQPQTSCFGVSVNLQEVSDQQISSKWWVPTSWKSPSSKPYCKPSLEPEDPRSIIKPLQDFHKIHANAHHQSPKTRDFGWNPERITLINFDKTMKPRKTELPRASRYL